MNSVGFLDDNDVSYDEEKGPYPPECSKFRVKEGEVETFLKERYEFLTCGDDQVTFGTILFFKRD